MIILMKSSINYTYYLNTIAILLLLSYSIPGSFDYCCQARTQSILGALSLFFKKR